MRRHKYYQLLFVYQIVFISEHTSSGMSVNIDIELSMLYNQTYILYLISCIYYINYCIIIIYYYHEWYTVYSYCTFSEDSICPGGPRHKPYGFLEDLHGHNYVFCCTQLMYIYSML